VVEAFRRITTSHYTETKTALVVRQARRALTS
jgi:hypothetical protein